MPATPGAAVNTADANLGVNLQHDDSYCANHLLFDDWFFSSIAPDPSNFGSTGGRNQQKTFTDFVAGMVPLDNRAYRPIESDARLAAADPKKAEELFKNHVKKADGYRSVASRIEVEGMFNVNSTSVTAWRALLGHARNQRVPYLRESGGGWNVDLSGLHRSGRRCRSSHATQVAPQHGIRPPLRNRELPLAHPVGNLI